MPERFFNENKESFPFLSFSLSFSLSFFFKHIAHRESRSELLIGSLIQQGWAGRQVTVCSPLGSTFRRTPARCSFSAGNTSLVLCSFFLQGDFSKVDFFLVQSNNWNRAQNPMKIIEEGFWPWMVGAEMAGEKKTKRLLMSSHESSQQMCPKSYFPKTISKWMKWSYYRVCFSSFFFVLFLFSTT